MGFNPREFVEQAVEEIRRTVGDSRAVAACSGGVDSTVAAVLAQKALGDRLTVVYINDGFRREGEPEWAVGMLRGLGLDVLLVDARREFLEAVRGLRDAEEKRKAFRHTFYSVLGRVAREVGARVPWVQGNHRGGRGGDGQGCQDAAQRAGAAGPRPEGVRLRGC
jgi:GMP synthase (glutamine-hydrolyzing) (EC 6.3.5.2)